MRKIRPLQDHVIIRRVKEEEKSKGGIIIPDSAKQKPVEGEVLAVGNGKVQEDWEQTDMLGLMQQLGVVPKLA